MLGVGCNGDILLMLWLLAPLINSSCKGGSAGRGTSLKKPKTSPFTTCSNMGTPFAHPEIIWVLSLCKYSTNCPRQSETIYSYHKAWEPSVPNGVICIVNGNALLVCSIWLCTGALMGGLVNRFSHSKLPCCSVEAVFGRTTAPSGGSEQNSETERVPELCT